MIRKLYITGLTILLSGCAYTLEGVMAEEPELVVEVVGSAEKFSECLYNSWFNLGPTFKKEEDGKTIISINYNGAVGVAAEVESTPVGTKASFYNPNILTSSKFREAFEGCV